MKKENAFEVFFIVIFAVAIGIFVVMLDLYFTGYVFINLWDWFIIPIFNLPKLSIYTAIGISIVVRFLIGHVDIKTMLEKKTNKEQWLAVAMLFLRPAMFLFAGYILYLMME